MIQKGYADQILLVGDTIIKEAWSGKTSLEFARKETIKLGIPESRVYIKHSTESQIDAILAISLMSKLGLKSALVISDLYNMRRLGMVFNHVFIDSNLKLILVPANYKRASPDNWWILLHSFVYIIKEWIKLPLNYYLLLSQTHTNKIKLPPEHEEDLAEKYIEPRLDSNNIFFKNYFPNLSRLIKFTKGRFHEVDEDVMDDQAVVFTTKLSSEVMSCYQRGNCNIYILCKIRLHSS